MNNNYDDQESIFSKRNKLFLECSKKITTMQADYNRKMIRSAHPDKTDKELGLDQPFFQEKMMNFWEEKILGKRKK